MNIGNGIPEGIESSTRIFNRPTVLILDQSDMILRRYGVEEVFKAVQLLVLTSEVVGLKVMIVVTSWERALELRDNTGAR